MKNETWKTTPRPTRFSPAAVGNVFESRGSAARLARKIPGSNMLYATCRLPPIRAPRAYDHLVGEPSVREASERRGPGGRCQPACPYGRPAKRRSQVRRVPEVDLRSRRSPGAAIPGLVSPRENKWRRVPKCHPHRCPCDAGRVPSQPTTSLMIGTHAGSPTLTDHHQLRKCHDATGFNEVRHPSSTSGQVSGHPQTDYILAAIQPGGSGG